MKRYQRKRTKGWAKPENCIYVGRGSKYGNPFQVGKHVSYDWFNIFDSVDTLEYITRDNIVPNNKEAVRLFIKYQLDKIKESDLHELMGKDIMCFCKENDICHGDVYIDLNRRWKTWTRIGR